MGACGYVSPVMRIKQEIIELTIELESMGKEKEFCKKVLEDDILNFYANDSIDRFNQTEKKYKENYESKKYCMDKNIKTFSSLQAFEIGKEFHYINKNKLVINLTSIEDVNKYFGKPIKNIVSDNKNGHFNIYEYYFIHTELTGGDERLLMMEFKDGILIGYVYDSSHDEDSTLFNYEEAVGVEIGHSIFDVVSKVGHPSGKAICPVNIHKYREKCVQGKNLFVWIYTPGISIFGVSSVETKFLFVGIDDNNIVTDVSFETQIGDGD